MSQIAKITQRQALGYRVPSRVMLTLAMAAIVGQWRGRHRSRRALARLSSHLMRDIGLDPATCAKEARRPFWKA